MSPKHADTSTDTGLSKALDVIAECEGDDRV